MAFVEMPGVTGKVYVPDDEAGGNKGKKHKCPDCHYCQWCSDDRCELCLSGKNCDILLRKGDCKK